MIHEKEVIAFSRYGAHFYAAQFACNGASSRLLSNIDRMANRRTSIRRIDGAKYGVTV
jgi:hypothetical protein